MPGYCFAGGAATREGRSREGFSREAKTRPPSSRGSAAHSSGGFAHIAFTVLIPPATQASFSLIDAHQTQV